MNQKKYNKNEVNIIPRVVPITTVLEPTPVMAIKKAPIITAKADVSPIEPGTVPIKSDIQLKSPKLFPESTKELCNEPLRKLIIPLLSIIASDTDSLADDKREVAAVKPSL
mgnify:CR=1 FL=1